MRNRSSNSFINKILFDTDSYVVYHPCPVHMTNLSKTYPDQEYITAYSYPDTIELEDDAMDLAHRLEIFNPVKDIWVSGMATRTLLHPERRVGNLRGTEILNDLKERCLLLDNVPQKIVLAVFSPIKGYQEKLENFYRNNGFELVQGEGMVFGVYSFART